MIPIQTDSLGQSYIEWAQTDDDSPARFKRAWISRREAEKDWAGTGRYLNVVRIDHNRAGSGGAPTDFPIYSSLTDAQVLEAFVAGVAQRRDARCLNAIGFQAEQGSTTAVPTPASKKTRA